MTNVLRWSIRINDEDHPVHALGLVVPAAEMQTNKGGSFFDAWLSFWTVEYEPDPLAPPRLFRVFGTGHDVPDDYVWRATAPRVDGLVFHLFERAGE